MASNIWTAVWGFVAGLAVTVVASYLTAPPREEGLKGLVYSRALKKEEAPTAWYRTPKFYAAVVIAALIALNWKFF